MKDQNQHIKDLFSKKIGGFESPVDTHVWSSIESSISSSAGATASSGTGSITVGMKIAIALTAIAAVAATVILLNQNDSVPTTLESSQFKITEDEFSEKMNSEDQGEKLPVIDSSSYEEILHPTKEPQTETPIQMADDPVNVYHSEKIQYYPITRGTPAVVSPPPNTAPEIAQKEIKPSVVEAEEDEVELYSEFTVWRDPKNPMRFTFTPVVANAESYQWSIDDQDVSLAKNLNYEFNDEGNYSVMLIISTGGSSSFPQEADITAYKKPKVIVPNIISPNGDGRNDALDLETLSINVSIENITIYDGSGKFVFESSSAGLKWDGKDRFGEACAEGNYICIYKALGIDQKPYVGREIVRIER